MKRNFSRQNSFVAQQESSVAKPNFSSAEQNSSVANLNFFASGQERSIISWLCKQAARHLESDRYTERPVIQIQADTSA
ncbi:hypothetical protein [Candidatus Electronema sp. TJ]|uniref:hypothetical protein n=1 Tax=Candidatus Electronema sp. TJ TaxID=3401573 RepID=UPI003AA80077